MFVLCLEYCGFIPLISMVLCNGCNLPKVLFGPSVCGMLIVFSQSLSSLCNRTSQWLQFAHVGVQFRERSAEPASSTSGIACTEFFSRTPHRQDICTIQQQLNLVSVGNTVPQTYCVGDKTSTMLLPYLITSDRQKRIPVCYVFHLTLVVWSGTRHFNQSDTAMYFC